MFHTAWVTEIARALNNGELPEGFYAESEQVAGQTGPDVLTLEAESDWTSQGRMHALESAGATTSVAAPPRVSVTQVASEQEIYAEQRNRLVIRHSSGDDLIAYIEIVSSGNKYVEPLAVGMALPEMALFLDPQWYVTVLLESTYCAAWEAIPARWRRVLSQ